MEITNQFVFYKGNFAFEIVPPGIKRKLSVWASEVSEEG